METEREIRFQLEENVIIKITGAVGIVVNLIFTPKEVKYLVSYADVNNNPTAAHFYECELEEITDEKFGFRGVK